MEKIEFDIFIKGETVDLVCLSEEVVEKTNWYKWFNDEENMLDMQQHYFPNTKADQLEFFRTQIKSNRKKLQMGILHKQNNILIGMISLSDIDFQNRKCEIAGFVGEKEYKNFTPFIEACKLTIKHAFDNLNMHKIYGGTTIKEVSLMLCKCLGFVEEGVKRQEIYKNGHYNDVHLVGLLREKYYGKC